MRALTRTLGPLCGTGLIALLAHLSTGTAHAEEGKDPKDGGDTEEMNKLLDAQRDGAKAGSWEDEEPVRKPTFPWFEHHGYFRFRADFFHNGHLSTVIPGDAKSGSSGLPAPLTENAINNDGTDARVASQDAKVNAGANIRLRYSPTLHLTEDMRIRATFDVLDNLVLGSTPDFDGNLRRPDVPLSAFNQNQAPPSDGTNGFRDGIRVKEAYGEFQPAFVLRVGRQASNWGLGILANSNMKHGQLDVDDDFGDYTDRALLLFKVFDIYVAAAWDYVYAGAISDDPAQAFGQPKDLGTADDVNQYVISLFQRPLSEADKEKRRADIYERFLPSFDWGLYAVYRTQEFDLDNTSFEAARENGGALEYDNLGLVPRNAWALIPDLWFRYEQRFDFYQGLRLELELVTIMGAVDNVNNELGGPDSARDLQQFGAAFEAQYDYGQLSLGLDAGFATGDSAEGFGVLDRNTLSEQDGSPNSDVTAFKFDRDYQVDLILFREVIGTVTNALYVKPWVAYDFFDQPEKAFGLRLDALYAQALVPEATPGNEAFLGFETDLRLFYHNNDGFKADLETGLLLPGGALNYRPVDGNNRDAELAFTLQGRLTFAY
jgi:uncharacterized protein (TIGR04551 family)